MLDFVGFMEEFHRNGKLVRGANNSFIMLIPKKDSPLTLGDHRPISLIGCIYKVLSNVIVNRLKKVLDPLIFEIQ